jgi:hypothetical protein
VGEWFLGRRYPASRSGGLIGAHIGLGTIGSTLWRCDNGFKSWKLSRRRECSSCGYGLDSIWKSKEGSAVPTRMSGHLGKVDEK